MKKLFTSIFFVFWGLQCYAQVLKDTIFYNYRDSCIIADKNDIEWEKTIATMVKNGNFSLEDNFIVHKFTLNFANYSKKQIFDHSMNGLFSLYNSPGNDFYICDYTGNDDVSLVKQFDMINCDYNTGIINWIFYSPIYKLPALMGSKHWKFSSYSEIQWVVSEGKIDITEKVKYIYSAPKPFKSLDGQLTPSMLTPFGSCGSFMGFRSGLPAIECKTSQAMLSPYIADQLLYKLVKSSLDKELQQVDYKHKFLLQSSGDFLTPDGKSYIVINYDSKSASELYNTYLEALTLQYKNVKDNLSSIENKVISVNAFTKDDFFWKDKMHLNMQYVLKFQFKDGRVRIEAPTIVSLNQKEKGSDYVSFKESAENYKIFVTDYPFDITAINVLNKVMNDIVDSTIKKVENSNNDDW